MNKTEQQTPLDRALAKPMFLLTLVWLGIAGVAMQLAGDEQLAGAEQGRFLGIAQTCGWLLLGLWTLFIAEAVAHAYTGGIRLHRHLAACLFPPLRLVGWDHVNGKTVWVPGWGWKTAGDELAEKIEIKLGYPMIAVALLVIPLFVVQQFFKSRVESDPQFAMNILFIEGFVWFVFAAEFVFMITLVSQRVKYAKDHWLDLAIICLPAIAFLRSLRVFRLAKASKVFRLKGLAMRGWRAILVLQIVDRLLHRDPEKRLSVLEKKISEKREEIEALEAEMMVLEQRLAAVGKSVDTPSTG